MSDEVLTYLRRSVSRRQQRAVRLSQEAERAPDNPAAHAARTWRLSETMRQGLAEYENAWKRAIRRRKSADLLPSRQPQTETAGAGIGEPGPTVSFTSRRSRPRRRDHSLARLLRSGV